MSSYPGLVNSVSSAETSWLIDFFKTPYGNALIWQSKKSFEWSSVDD